MEDGSYIKKAQAVLDAVLEEGKSPQSKTKEPMVSVSMARQNPVFIPETGRTKTRVLFVTTDVSILTQTKKTLDGFTAIADVFHEVHIMVLRTGIPAKHPVLRVDTNTWLYTVTAKQTWQLPFAAWQMMRQELSFADGFRPDVIVAREVEVSAFTAYGAGYYYDRPIQLHIPEYYQEPKSLFKRWFNRALIRKFPSIRVMTDEMIRVCTAWYKDIADIDVLPRFRDYLSLFDGNQGNYLRQKYPQFNFIVLYIGDLTTTSTAFGAIDAVRTILRNPRVGFLMIGNGTGVMECERRATLLGIKDQVVIERRAEDIRQCVGSADIMIVTDKNNAADEVALYGASAGVPMVITRTPLRSDFFEDGVSAFLVDDVRSLKMGEILNRLLNNNTERYVMRQKARQTAEVKLHMDPVIYQTAYRSSIESAILANESDES